MGWSADGDDRHADVLVGGDGACVTGRKLDVVMSGGQCDQRVVDSAARDAKSGECVRQLGGLSTRE
jgi:hypothetical protein